VAKGDFNGELIHFGAVRYRTTGSGQLLTTILSLDSQISSFLPNIALAPKNAIEPTILANFIQQRGKLRIGTVNKDEYFSISRIIVYVKPVASGYPQ